MKNLLGIRLTAAYNTAFASSPTLRSPKSERNTAKRTMYVHFVGALQSPADVLAGDRNGDGRKYLELGNARILSRGRAIPASCVRVGVQHSLEVRSFENIVHEAIERDAED